MHRESLYCPSVCRLRRERKNCTEKSMETCKQIKLHTWTHACTYIYHMAHLHAASHTDKLGWEVISVCVGPAAGGGGAAAVMGTVQSVMSWCSKYKSRGVSVCTIEQPAIHFTSTREVQKHNMLTLCMVMRHVWRSNSKVLLSMFTIHLSINTVHF